MSNEPKDSNNTKKLAMAGLLASAAAGAVYLYGKNKKRAQKRLRGWVLKVKGEVMDKIASVETLTRSQYNDFVDTAIAEYADKKRIAKPEVEKLRSQLKSRWQDITTHVTEGIETVEDGGVNTVKSAATQALTGAAEELSAHKDKDTDPVELLKRAGVSGAETLIKELTTSVRDTDNKEADTKE
jgi:hypothetical protein